MISELPNGDYYPHRIKDTEPLPDRKYKDIEREVLEELAMRLEIELAAVRAEIKRK